MKIKGKKAFGVKRLAALFMVCVFCFSFITGCSTESGQKGKIDNSNASGTESGKKDEKEATVKVGGTYQDKKVKFTVNSATVDYKFDDPYDLYELKDGMVYMLVEFTVENIGDKGDLYVSTSDFECYADNTKCENEYISEVCGDFVVGSVSPGRNVTFKVLYKVPANSEHIQLEYDADFWSDEKVKIDIK